METKICSKCGIEKSINDFNKTKSMCKSCEKEYKREYYQRNKDNILKKTSEYRNNNREKVIETNRKYKESHRQLLRDKAKKYYYENREQILDNHKEYMKEYNKKYYAENKDKLSIKKKKYQKENAERIKEYRKKYDESNREKVRETHRTYLRNYTKDRKKNDPLFKMIIQIRGMISGSFTRRGYTKRSHTYEILGTDYNTFYKHLLNTFKKNYGYDWDGHEEVHIDHIVPLATAENEDDIIALCHYTNLQLLKGKDNLIKGDKIDWNIGK